MPVPLALIVQTEEHRTYHKPKVNTRTTISFFCFAMFKSQTALTGRKRIKKSVMVLKHPLVFNSMEVSTQNPLTALLNIFALGLHSNIFTKLVLP